MSLAVREAAVPSLLWEKSMSESNAIPGGSSTASEQADSGLEPTVEDDLHHAMCAVSTAADNALELLKESDNYDESDVDRQKEYLSFLHKVISGPRGFTDPEGTGHVAPSNTKQYRKQFGNQAPALTTEPLSDKQMNVLFEDGTLSEISGNSIPEQDTLNLPYSQTYDKLVYVAPPEGHLDDAKEIVRDVVERHIPESVSWFKYMNGDESALQDVSDSSDSGTTTTNDSGNDSGMEPELDELVSHVEGIGTETAKNLRRYIAKTGWQAPESVEMELGPAEKYDSIAEVPTEELHQMDPDTIDAIRS